MVRREKDLSHLVGTTGSVFCKVTLSNLATLLCNMVVVASCFTARVAGDFFNFNQKQQENYLKHTRELVLERIKQA